MSEKLTYEKLMPGYEFLPVRFSITAETAELYIGAVEDSSGLYAGQQIIPPMAVAARAMAAMGEGFVLPGGTIHVSQEFEFKKIVKAGEVLTSVSRVERRQDRSKFHMLTIGLNVTDGENETVITGKTGFILPG